MTGQPKALALPPRARAALAVFAHPDDETFGLGAVLNALVDAGTAVEGLCFTRGEASTLRARPDNSDQLGALGDLGAVREAELADAAGVLGLDHCELLTYPDGRLAETPVAVLAAHVLAAAQRQPADLLVVFDHGGITGHPDHEHATRAAVVAAAHLDIGVLAWAVPERVATALNTELGTDFEAAPLPRSTSPSPSTATANAAPSPATAASPPTTPCCAAASSSPARPNRSAGSADPAIPVIPRVPVRAGNGDERSQTKARPALEGGSLVVPVVLLVQGGQVARDVMAVAVM
jgi:LmbE family N-acetylglucosaminyl deacetylase